MKIFLRARWLRFGLFPGLLFAGSQALALEYETQFVKGMRARDQGDWAQAIIYFRAAVAARSGEGVDRVRLYGMLSAPYLPHYYLGEAYANAGNCEGALEQLAESERQGFVQKAGKYNSLLKLRAQCQGLVGRAEAPRPVAPVLTPTAVVVVAPPTQMPRPTPTENTLVQDSLREAQLEVSRAESAAAVTAKLRGSSANSGIWQKDPSLGAKEEKAKDDLAAARAALEEGKARSDVSRLRAAREGAIRANQEFGDLQRLVSDSQKTAAQASAIPGTLLRDINSARQLLADVSRNQSLPEEAVGPKASLERLLRETSKQNSATPSEQRAFEDRLKSATRRLTDALGTAPAQFASLPLPLVEGASAYFEGDYSRAARTLESAPEFTDHHAAAEARLIRSAARYALYIIGGAKDSGLQRQALQDANDCRRLDPKISPNRKVFSPRFVRFFMEVTTSRAAR